MNKVHSACLNFRKYIMVKDRLLLTSLKIFHLASSTLMVSFNHVLMHFLSHLLCFMIYDKKCGESHYHVSSIERQAGL